MYDEYSIGDLVVARVAYPMSMHKTPNDCDLDANIVWDYGMSGVIIDIVTKAGITYLKIFTSTSSTAWMIESFVKRAK
jgi:hypothetical protein